MSTLVHGLLAAALGELRYEPTTVRIRAALAGETVIDSTRAVLVWEPGHVVPAYAVPEKDIRPGVAPVSDGDRRARHTAEGARVVVRGKGRDGSGLRLVAPDLAGYVVLDFTSFDAWYEEDEPISAHPHDPFHRIDVRASSRHVRLERDGQVLAESSRTLMLFETLLPTRYYIPREDVVVELEPSDTQTACAYKGRAAYFSARVGDRLIRDLAWTLPEPLPEGERVGGLVAFFNERVDIVIDGQRLDAPVDPWHPATAPQG
ncbi:MAG: DUF427 domain-containing protein [Promicromonosporaceae bacterium]|nr:DUF427 domain-containing protein [Promicromonosporaceae bacterium]